jgi:hypothetical protein
VEIVYTCKKEKDGKTRNLGDKKKKNANFHQSINQSSDHHEILKNEILRYIREIKTDQPEFFFQRSC